MLNEVNGSLLCIKTITMKKSILILLLLLPLTGVFAQLRITNGTVFTIPAGYTQYVNDVFIEAGGILNNEGSLHISGNLKCNGVITAMNDLVFDGTSPQLYFGEPMTVGTLAINNAAGVAIGAPVTVSTATTFIAGLLVTATASPLIYVSGAAPGAPTDNSHVNGPVQYNGAGAFTFPVGDAAHYRPVGVNLTSNASGMTASYFPEAAPAGKFTGLLQSVSKFEYWMLMPGSTASGTVTLNRDVDQVSAGIADARDVAVVHVAHFRDGNWVNEGSAGTTGPVTSRSVGAWGAFTLGGTGRSNDPDRKATYSKTVAARPVSGSISLVPNPVKDHLTVGFGAGMDGRYTLDLLGVDGRQVYHTSLQVAGGQSFTIGRPAGMISGIYIVRVRDENGNVQMFKLMFE